MSGRGLLSVVILAVGAAGIFFSIDEENRNKFAEWFKSVRANSAKDGDSADSMGADLGLASSSHSGWPQASPDPAGWASSGDRPDTPNSPPIYSLEQLLRFDVTPSWVIDNWPRVTTRLVDGQLEGLRVTLVTGTEAHDLVGSLTYYFDKQLQLQRILFHGHTGDPKRLVGLVTQYYGLQLDPAVGGWLFTAKWNTVPTSILHVQHVPVVTADNRRHRVQVDLELNRPGAPYGLSTQSQKFLTARNAPTPKKQG